MLLFLSLSVSFLFERSQIHIEILALHLRKWLFINTQWGMGCGVWGVSMVCKVWGMGCEYGVRGVGYGV